MKIYSLTPLGMNIANSPTANPSMERKILYFLKRHGGSVSDDRLLGQLGEENRGQVTMALRHLTSGKNPPVAIISG